MDTRLKIVVDRSVSLTIDSDTERLYGNQALKLTEVTSFQEGVLNVVLKGKRAMSFKISLYFRRIVPIRFRVRSFQYVYN